MAKVNLPYGIDDFAKVRTNDCYYIDKTGWMKELLSETFDVNLITRPRRFGKTLAMSMLAEFFDIRKDSRKMFNGLEIAEETDFCEKWMNQWPVLFLTLKDVDGRKFEGAYDLLQYTISALCIEHAYLMDSDRVDESDKERFLRLKGEKGRRSDVKSALLQAADLKEALPGMKKWYDGYVFGETELYCPWDVINHVRALMTDRKAKPNNYWLDTSHNNIIKRFIEQPNINVNDKFETLLAGGVIQEPIREDLTYDIDHSSEANLWSILYLTGYLTQVLPWKLPEGMRLAEGNMALRIPNEEVKSVFGDTVKKWFEEEIREAVCEKSSDGGLYDGLMLWGGIS